MICSNLCCTGRSRERFKIRQICQGNALYISREVILVVEFDEFWGELTQNRFLAMNMAHLSCLALGSSREGRRWLQWGFWSNVPGTPRGSCRGQGAFSIAVKRRWPGLSSGGPRSQTRRTPRERPDALYLPQPGRSASAPLRNAATNSASMSTTACYFRRYGTSPSTRGWSASQMTARPSQAPPPLSEVARRVLAIDSAPAISGLQDERRRNLASHHANFSDQQ
jgi:hypothetical protein